MNDELNCRHSAFIIPTSPFQSCGGRNRTCDVTFNRRPPVPTRAPPQSKSGRRDLNPRSRAPDDHRCAAVPGGIPGFPTSCSLRAPAGVATRTSAMRAPPRSGGRRQAAATSWALSWCAELSKNFSVVALRVELSATRLSAEFGQPALDYHFISATRTGVEPVLPP